MNGRPRGQTKCSKINFCLFALPCAVFGLDFRMSAVLGGEALLESPSLLPAGQHYLANPITLGNNCNALCSRFGALLIRGGYLRPAVFEQARKVASSPAQSVCLPHSHTHTHTFFLSPSSISLLGIQIKTILTYTLVLLWLTCTKVDSIAMSV